MRRMRKVISLLGVVAALLAGVTTSAAAAPAPPPSTVVWTPCFAEVTAETGTAYECGQVSVPLDYDRPQGRSIAVEMVRVPAADPARRIGSILLNPGGPGASGIDMALGFGPFARFVLGDEVADRFDLVGFDPRGIARSTPLLCYPTFEDSLAGASPVPFPTPAAEVAAVTATDRNLAGNCKRRGGPIAEHMSTANVARDMDRIRQAVGDDTLSYLGLSYGTFLGTTYANLFPNQIRAMVIDGVLDPVAYVNKPGRIPFSTALRSDEGAQETLESLFRACEEAAPGNCALAPGSRQRFAAVADALRTRSITVADPVTGELVEVTYSIFISFVLSNLYNPFAFAVVATAVADLEAALQAPAAAAAPPAVDLSFGRRHRPPQELYSNLVEGFPAVACTDSNNPDRHSAWTSAGLAADREFGYFGRPWTWQSSTCAVWPFKDDDRYTGPFTATTSNPVLVIGNLYDPATRYEGAQAVRRLLRRSSLLTVDVSGHTSLGLSGCAGSITGQYLVDPSIAPSVDGFTCPAEINPFDNDAGPPAAVARGAAPAVPSGVSPEVRRVLDDLIGGGRP